ncbi:MAG: hypothetical protein H6810_02485 [Phycisphaeraceae bacterium]|nr:MAG: hypothetical protein H6810_02485 [Phycisphaeraceae bacterium]
MRPPIIVPTSCLVLTFCAGLASAAIINVPADQPFIQAGINAAVTGDEVVVAPGTYAEIIDFAGKAITVRSSGGADVTILDATSVADPGDGLPVVRFDNGEGADSVLEGFTLTGGTGDTATIGSSGHGVGGGVWIYGATPTIRDCVIEHNSAFLGGGLFVYQGGLTLTGCTVRLNDAPGGSAGAMSSFQCDDGVTVDGCTFDGNTGQNGAGILCDFGVGAVVFTDSVIENHAATVDKSALFVGGDQTGTLTIDGCVFRNNSTPAVSLCSGALATSANQIARVTDCLFIGNSGDLGGAVAFRGLGGSFIANCVFIGNSAGIGGAVYLKAPGLALLNCSFAASTATEGSSVLFAANSMSTTLTNCIFWDDTGVDPISVAGNSGSFLTVNHSIVQGGWSGNGTGNLDVDPMFTDAANDDLSLQAGSPAIDSGGFDAYHTTYGVGLDAAGGARYIDDATMPNLGVGTIGYLDLGAYEYGQDEPLIEQQPSSAVGGAFQSVFISVDAPDATSYRWYFNGTPLGDDAHHSGTASPLLIVHVDDSTDQEGLYHCVVSDGVRTETSVDAGLVVYTDCTPDCLADLNGDGLLDLQDINEFINSFNAGCP